MEWFTRMLRVIQLAPDRARSTDLGVIARSLNIKPRSRVLLAANGSAKLPLSASSLRLSLFSRSCPCGFRDTRIRCRMPYLLAAEALKRRRGCPGEAEYSHLRGSHWGGDWLPCLGRVGKPKSVFMETSIAPRWRKNNHRRHSGRLDCS